MKKSKLYALSLCVGVLAVGGAANAQPAPAMDDFFGGPSSAPPAKQAAPAPNVTAAPAVNINVGIPKAPPSPIGVPVSAAPRSTGNTPAEQLIGSVSPEVFQEMSSIERDTALLTLQRRREELQNQINAVKSRERQEVLQEIERREVIAKSRVEWEIEQENRRLQAQERQERAALRKLEIEEMIKQREHERKMEQENKRLEVEKKKAEDEMKLRMIEAEAKAQEAIAKAQAEVTRAQAGTEPSVIDEKAAAAKLEILEIRGIGEDLLAKVGTKDGKASFFVREGAALPTGHEVMKIERDFIVLRKDGVDEQIGFRSGGISSTGAKAAAAALSAARSIPGVP